MTHKYPASFVLFGALLLAPAAFSQTTWTGAASTDYGTAGNWSASAAPPNSVDVLMNTATPNATIMAANTNWDRQGLKTTTISGNGSMTLPSGRLLNNGTFNMTGGSLNTTGDYFIVGTGANGVGTFNHSAGTVTVYHNRGFQLSDNAITQNGSVYNLSGTAVLNVTSDANYADVNLRHVWIGKGGDSPLTTVTDANAGDAFNVMGGAATFSKNTAGTQISEIRISRNSGFIVSGGSLTFNDYNDLNMGSGHSQATKNRIVVSGGTLTFNRVPNLYVGTDDPGSITVSGGDFEAPSSFMTLGSSTSAGAVTMTGGIMNVNLIIGTNGVFDFRGGDLYVMDDLRNAALNQPWLITSNATGTVKVDFDQDTYTSHVYVVQAAPTGFAAWLTQYPSLADKTEAGDSDGDGLSNLLEYALGANPTVSSRSQLPVMTQNGADFIFTFTRQTASLQDTTQAFEYSTDLVNWTDVPLVGTVAGSVTVTNTTSTTQQVQVILAKSHAVNGMLYGRLKVTRP